jgi:hypothetical protein
VARTHAAAAGCGDIIVVAGRVLAEVARHVRGWHSFLETKRSFQTV